MDDEDDEVVVVESKHSKRLRDRKRASNLSSGSNSSSSGHSSGGSSVLVQQTETKATNGGTTVEIERNDSGLGSETGKPKMRPVVMAGRHQVNQGSLRKKRVEAICEDCDQVITEKAANER